MTQHIVLNADLPNMRLPNQLRYRRYPSWNGLIIEQCSQRVRGFLIVERDQGFPRCSGVDVHSSSNDQVERRALSQTEGTLFRSFDPPGPHRSCDTLLQPIVRCHSQLVLGEVECAMKHAQNHNVQVVLNEVSDSVMPKQKQTDGAFGRTVALPNVRKLAQHLHPVINSLNGAQGGRRVVQSNVLENVREPSLSLPGPNYLCQDRMRRCISSFDNVR